MRWRYRSITSSMSSARTACVWGRSSASASARATAPLARSTHPYCRTRSRPDASSGASGWATSHRCRRVTSSPAAVEGSSCATQSSSRRVTFSRSRRLTHSAARAISSATSSVESSWARYSRVSTRLPTIVPTRAASISQLRGIRPVCGIGSPSGRRKSAVTANQSARPPTMPASAMARRKPPHQVARTGYVTTASPAAASRTARASRRFGLIRHYSRRKSSMRSVALGPSGYVCVARRSPPLHACPIPGTSQVSSHGRPAPSR